MLFDSKRLATLAGIKTTGKSNLLSEAQNRSYHEDPGFSDADVDNINQVNEELTSDDDVSELFGEVEESLGGDYNEPTTMTAFEEEWSLTGDTVFEINESDLRREIIRMKKLRSRKQRANGQSLQERNLRSTIRKEIRNVLGNLDLNRTAEWLYGDNKPSQSKKGYVSIGARGIGFK